MNGYSNIGPAEGNRLSTGTATTALGTLERNIEAHLQTVSGLLQRLEAGGVLRPTPPTATGVNVKDPATMACALAIAIGAQASRLLSLTAQVADVIERLDV